MKQRTTKSKGAMLILVALFYLFFFFLEQGLAWEVGTMPPTLKELTNGKVQEGDLITKDNVDVVKDLLPPGVYQTIKDGAVIEVVKQAAPKTKTPKFFWEATKKNHEQYGDPVVDKNSVIYTKEGKPWPGGLPYLNPANVYEVMANMKYGEGLDDITFYQTTYFVNPEGKVYKTQRMEGDFIWCGTRKQIPPIGSVPGLEKELERSIPRITYPLDLKGLGQLATRYWDEVKNPDEGFVYLPAFKRVIRVSSSTYQDNIGGSDFTWGDPHGIREPLSYWEFKGGEIKLMLAPVLWGDPVIKTSGGEVLWPVKYDCGMKYPRFKYAVTPLHVVEATPKIKHIYSRKTLYIYSPDYWPIYIPCIMADIYDLQGNLWKSFNSYENVTYPDPISKEQCPIQNGMSMFDLQTGHTSHFTAGFYLNQGIMPDMLDMKYLISKGR